MTAGPIEPEGGRGFSIREESTFEAAIEALKLKYPTITEREIDACRDIHTLLAQKDPYHYPAVAGTDIRVVPLRPAVADSPPLTLYYRVETAQEKMPSGSTEDAGCVCLLDIQAMATDPDDPTAC